MKKLGIIMLCLAAMIGCQSRQVTEPDQVDRIVGDYSYKISGVATVDSDSVQLSDEIGAMEIVRIDSAKALVTFNTLAGPAYFSYLAVNGSNLTLQPYERIIRYNRHDYALVCSGNGTVYDKTILFEIHYAMQQPDSVRFMTADKLTMLCKKN